eukprot:UN12388
MAATLSEAVFFLDSTIQMSLITLQTRAGKMHAVGF